MPDWKLDPPDPKPPGATDPKPGAQDPGWSQWIKKIADEINKNGGGAGSYDVSLDVQRGPSVRFYLSGEKPTDWEKEGVTFKTKPPAKYRDFTRFRRKYSSITWKYFRKITVVLRIRFPDGTAFESKPPYEFWEPDGTSFTFTNHWIHRWKESSGESEGEGAVPAGEWSDDTVPEHWDEYKYPDNDEDSPAPEPKPPEKFFSRVETPGGDFVAFSTAQRRLGLGWSSIRAFDVPANQWVNRRRLGGGNR